MKIHKFHFKKIKNYEQNTVAERLNGILKDEFYLDQTFDNVIYSKSAINLYNQIRLHVSLDYKTPNMVYKLTA